MQMVCQCTRCNTTLEFSAETYNGDLTLDVELCEACAEADSPALPDLRPGQVQTLPLEFTYNVDERKLYVYGTVQGERTLIATQDGDSEVSAWSFAMDLFLRRNDRDETVLHDVNGQFWTLSRDGSTGVECPLNFHSLTPEMIRRKIESKGHVTRATVPSTMPGTPRLARIHMIRLRTSGSEAWVCKWATVDQSYRSAARSALCRTSAFLESVTCE